MTSESLVEAIRSARAWVESDPDPESRAELTQLIEAESPDLVERMGPELQFGTAGLRGVVGAGRARMNRAVVMRAARGVADYVRDRVLDGRTLPIVVGRDARLTSDRFMRDTIDVLVGAGLNVRYFAEPVPTPLVAYAARQLGAVAAICITASHNPPEYNGFKVYASNAAQIIPPVDAEIAKRIANAGAANSIRRAQDALETGHERVEAIGDSMVERYHADVDSLRPPHRACRDMPIVYTPLHGVGDRFVHRAFALAGFTALSSVPSQKDPDGKFPTVNFPNPEEPGALDAAVAVAEDLKAPLILANDPDADRLAVCARTPSGRYVPFTGNQIGLLLADYVLARAAATPQPLVLSSIVSSPMLGSIAEHYGAHFEQTLTGFKWICNAALALEAAQSVRFAFGYEEALGYSIDRVVRDKDGVSAAVVFAEMVAECEAQKVGILDRLYDLYRRHGLWVSHQLSIVRKGSQGAADIAGAMQKLADDAPPSLAGYDVEQMRDFRHGGEARPQWLPETALIELLLGGGSRVLVRPSGTEPKLKIYVDLCRKLDADASVTGAETELLADAERVAEAVAATIGLHD